MLLSTFVTALGLVSSARAWGPLGHKTVANVALQFLQPGVAESLNAILAADGRRNGTNPNIVSVATWPDEYVKLESGEGKWTREFHFIDARDKPPFDCNMNLTRDCDGHGGCAVTAIANYTNQLIHPSRNADETAMALKFVVHLLGDIAQPLHTEFLGYGGNLIFVKWDGVKSRLHGVWDYNMIGRFIGPDDESSLNKWTKTIVDEIKYGAYTQSVPQWLSCTDVKQAQDCALEWAIDSNKLVCNYVLKTDPTDLELNGTYYDGAAPLIQQQIAKGGVRLAAWLNQIFGSAQPGELSFDLHDELLLQSS